VATAGRPVKAEQPRASLENLIEQVDVEFEILHPGDLDITRELAQRCEIGSDTYVLDVASGSGESACYLARQFGARVVGIDASQQMVDRAIRKVAQRGLGIEFRCADAHSLPFDDGTFDAVISECTLCLLDKQRALGEMVRVAKPGGYVGMHDICWRDDTPARIKQRLAEIEDERPETLQGWQQLFEQVGLTEITAIDKAALIPMWVKGIRRRLGLVRQLRIFGNVIRLWGWRGLRDVLESERIFQSPHTGYGIIVGRKPT
jgi:ubiquinone/menaquinone biosynthesis C-methylase UbiE